MTIDVTEASVNQSAPHVALLATGNTVSDAVTRLPEVASDLSLTDSLIVVSPRPSLALLDAILNVSPTSGPVSVALSPGSSSGAIERMRRWASDRGIRVVLLGSAGWARINLKHDAARLPYVDLPVELTNARVVLPTLLGRQSPLDIWADIVHPNSSLRARPLGRQGIAELSLAGSATYVMGTSRPTSCVVRTDDRVAALLLAHALQRVNETLSGVEAHGPWEEDDVQHLARLSAGIKLGNQLVIQADCTDNRTHQLALRIAEQVGAAVESVLGRS